jgi:hypothetical protein
MATSSETIFEPDDEEIDDGTEQQTDGKPMGERANPMCAGDVTDYEAMRSRAQLNAAAATTARPLPLRTSDSNFMMRAKASEQDVCNLYLCSLRLSAAVHN